jgi:hypothetical protein
MPERSLPCQQGTVSGTDLAELILTLPAHSPDAHAAVIAVEIAGAVDVDGRLLQDHIGGVTLTSGTAERLTDGIAPPPALDPNLGIVTDWTSLEQWLRWRFVITSPGVREVTVTTTNADHVANFPHWLGGHHVTLCCAGQQLLGELRPDRPSRNPRARYHAETVTVLGALTFPAPGEYTVELRATALNPTVPWGLALDTVQFTPFGATD